MKAAWFEKFGAARDVVVIGEKATPVAWPGEVRVRLRTSDVNPSPSHCGATPRAGR